MSCPVIELAQQLIRRPSLSPDDAGCQALMIERLRAIGFTVEPMDFGDTQNFWAWRGCINASWNSWSPDELT